MIDKLDILRAQGLHTKVEDTEILSFLRERMSTPVQDEVNQRFVNSLLNTSDPEQRGRFRDEWVSHVAQLNTPNSILASLRFIPYRLSYPELIQLSKEPYINKIITLKSRDIIGNKGLFKIKGKVVDNADIIIDKLEAKLTKLKFWETLERASNVAFIYGGALISVNTDRNSFEEQLPFNFNTYNNNEILAINVISPIFATANPEINSSPYNDDFIRVRSWSINGQHFNSSQIVTLIWQDVEPTEKYIYNYLGQPLIEKLAPAVRQYELINKMGIELFSKMRLILFKTQGIASKDNQQIIQQLEDLKTLVNNQSIVMISADDDIVNLTTTPTGLDDLLNKYAQNMCAVAGIPATKLLGYSPLGLNNTGEGDLKTYYDEIEGYQKTYLYPVIIDIAQRTLWSLGYDLEVDFEFTPLAQESNLEKTQRFQTYVSMIDVLINNGTIDNELAFKMLQEQGIISEHAEFPYENDDDFSLESTNEE